MEKIALIPYTQIKLHTLKATHHSHELMNERTNNKKEKNKKESLLIMSTHSETEEKHISALAMQKHKSGLHLSRTSLVVQKAAEELQLDTDGDGKIDNKELEHLIQKCKLVVTIITVRLSSYQSISYIYSYLLDRSIINHSLNHIFLLLLLFVFVFVFGNST